ncbi:MAG: trypsin-like peptidase domain-containing protein [Anaerolineales bacterium]
MKRVFLALSVLMIAALACNQGISFSPSQATQPASSTTVHVQTNPPLQVVSTDPAQQQDALVALYQAVLPGVVTIRTDTGLGSGFVFDAEGHIVTNQHVVDGASTVEVDFFSGYKAHGTVLASDSDADVAVVKTDAPAEEIHPLTIGELEHSPGRTIRRCHWQSFWTQRHHELLALSPVLGAHSSPMLPLIVAARFSAPPISSRPMRRLIQVIRAVRCSI